jgi:hypothetical protein
MHNKTLQVTPQNHFKSSQTRTLLITRFYRVEWTRLNFVITHADTTISHKSHTQLKVRQFQRKTYKAKNLLEASSGAKSNPLN